MDTETSLDCVRRLRRSLESPRGLVATVTDHDGTTLHYVTPQTALDWAKLAWIERDTVSLMHVGEWRWAGEEWPL